MRRIDENAFIKAYDELSEPLFRYCYFRVYDRDRAQDLMQETFTKAWQYLKDGKEIENLKAFLYRVAHNVCVNEAVRHKPLSLEDMREAAGFDPIDERAASPERDAEAAELIEKMQLLRPGPRELLTLRYLEGMDVTEIAESLDQTPNTISVRLRRALDELRAIMNTTTP